MGRMFYQVPKCAENERVVHVLSTEFGTIVLAIREPVIGERGYYIGVDNKIRDAVREMLQEWDDDAGPGWLHSNELARSKWSAPQPGDETITVTILAAYELDEHERTARGLADLDEAEAKDAEEAPEPSMGNARPVETYAIVRRRRMQQNYGSPYAPYRYEIASGEHHGIEFCVMSEDVHKIRPLVDRTVLVRFYPDDQWAKFVSEVMS